MVSTWPLRPAGNEDLHGVPKATEIGALTLARARAGQCPLRGISIAPALTQQRQ